MARGGQLLLCPGGGQATGNRAEMNNGVLAKDPGEDERAALDALAGQDRRQQGLSPRGSGLELMEPNFP